MSQFCRGCGTDLRAVRVSIERPDSVTASAVSAREEIGRAIAEKIRAVDNASDLTRVTHAVLPQIEKFLESPEEKRLRRLRAGVITALVGLGVWLPALVLTSVVNQDDAVQMLLTLIGLGAVTFTIGLSLVINGLLFTRPRKSVEDNSSAVHLQSLLDPGHVPPQLRAQTTSNLSQVPSSVTEHTTHHLKSGR